MEALSGREIFKEDSSTKKSKPNSRFDLNSATYLNRSNSGSETLNTDLYKESVNYIISTSTLKRSGNQERNEKNKTSIMNLQNLHKKDTQKTDSPKSNPKKPKRHLKINRFAHEENQSRLNQPEVRHSQKSKNQANQNALDQEQLHGQVQVLQRFELQKAKA